MTTTSTPAISNEPIQVDKERDETTKTSIEPIVISKIKSNVELKTPNATSQHFDKVYEEAFNKYSQSASEKKLQTKIKSKTLITDSTSQSSVVSSSTATSTVSSNKPLNLIIKKNKTDSVFQVNKVPKLIISTNQLKESSSKPFESNEEKFELKKPDLSLLNSFDENANDAIEFDGKDEDKNIEPIIWKPVFNTNTTNSPVSSPLVQQVANTTEIGELFCESSSVVPTSGPSLQPFTIKKSNIDASDTHNESTPQSDANVHKSKKKKKLKDKHKESPEKEKDKSKKKKKKKDKEKEKEKEKSQSNLESSNNTSLSSSEQKKKDKKLKKLMKKEQKRAESSKEHQPERDESHSATSTPEMKETTQKKPPNLIEAVR